MTDRNGRLGLFGKDLERISAVAGTLFMALSLAIGYVLRTEPKPTDCEEPVTTEVRYD